MNADPYVYPGTTVLRNTLGIRDPEALRRVEADLTFLRLVRLSADPLPGDYDLAHLQAFHRFLFEGLYEWAGELRSAQRAFFGQLAADAGHRLDWQRIDPKQNTQASITAMRGDEQPLRELLAEATS